MNKKENLEFNISMVIMLVMLAVTLALTIKFDTTNEMLASLEENAETTTSISECVTSSINNKTTVQNIIDAPVNITTEAITTTQITTDAVITTEEESNPDNDNVVKAAEAAPPQDDFIQQQEVVPEVNESNEETDNVVIQQEEPVDNAFYFFPDSGRVHTSTCPYCNKDSMVRIEGDYIEKARPCTTCNPSIRIGELYIPEDEHKQVHPELEGTFTEDNVITEMTYYKGDSYYCCGARGTVLTNNYSVASNYYPFGTILYIQSEDGSINGYYEVEDTGGMGNHVVDIYFNDYSLVPYSFSQLGRVKVQVWVVT